jgi:serine/threonine-protein kinase
MKNSADSAGCDRLVDQIIAAYLEAEAAGRPLDRAEILAGNPELAAELQAFFTDHDAMRRRVKPPETVTAEAGPRKANQGETGTLSPDQTPEAVRGTRIRYFGDYELLEEIARGGMGVVYRARQVSLNRIVALKMILAGQLAAPEDVERFHRRRLAESWCTSSARLFNKSGSMRTLGPVGSS